VLQIDDFTYDRFSGMVITCDLIVHLKSIVLLKSASASILSLLRLQTKD
jgi:hypothetical protein